LPGITGRGRGSPLHPDRKALYGLAGTDVGPAGCVQRSAAADDATALQRRFAEHPAAEGPDVAVRLTLVDALAQKQGCRSRGLPGDGRAEGIRTGT